MATAAYEEKKRRLADSLSASAEGISLGKRTSSNLFRYQPRSRANDGGASARFAMRIAKLNAHQRGTLHLVYGERLSYDEVAEIFDVPVSAIISRLAKCHAQLTHAEERDAAAPDMAPRRPQTEAEARRQGWAA